MTLDGSGSTDADGDILTYSWSFTLKPTGSTAALSNETVVNPTFTVDRDGSYVLYLVVNDGTVDSAADTITITAARVVPLPDTRQTNCYDSDASGTVIDCTGTGQDGEYSINPPSYTDNGDGTVTADVTGLMWQQSNSNTKYNWYAASGILDLTYNSSGTGVCGDLSLGGYTDWRLPTVNELESITDSGTYNPAIDTTAFPNTNSSDYWSSTAYAGSPSHAWKVSFHDGYVDGNDKTVNSYVRCVRGSEPPAQSFTDNGDGTVTDNVTGLMWQQEDDNIMKQWPGALNYCNGLSFAGHTDWRLPNKRELVSILDYSTYNPTIDTTAFPKTKLFHYWSSTTSANETSNVWYVLFDNSRVFFDDKTFNYYYVRCVR